MASVAFVSLVRMDPLLDVEKRSRLRSIPFPSGNVIVARPKGFRLKPYPPVANALAFGLEVGSEGVGWLRSRSGGQSRGWTVAEVDGLGRLIGPPVDVEGREAAVTYVHDAFDAIARE